jgi:peptidoglycan/xylan/chitin deacetylase (PgdA/CDA1 family)
MMRTVVGRALAVMALVACLGWLLQADDSAPPPAPETATAPNFGAPEGRPPGRDTYADRTAVVPFGRTTLELPILLYHYIRVPPSPRRDLVGYNLSVSPQQFADQMDWLSAHGYHTVTFADLRLYWQHVRPLPAKPVIVTLDDGYQDLYTSAFPILAAHGFTAVAYIVTGFVGNPGYVTRDEIVEMDQYGIEIGAHTVNHVNLAHSSQPWMAYQLIQSKAWLEQLVGHAVPDMAYPSGKYDAEVVAAVERAGYYSAVTEEFTYLHSQEDRYVWGRVRVSAAESMKTFIADLGPAMPTVMITTTVVTPTPAALQQQT